MIIIVMGVTGCGKSTTGRLLADHLGLEFFDGDDFHPQENIEKMASGQPLTDADRVPWLVRLNELIEAHVASGDSMVLACSALTQSFRDRLAGGELRQLVHLQVPADVISRRLSERSGHFMPASLVESQFEALEAPTAAIAVDGTLPADELVALIHQRLAPL